MTGHVARQLGMGLFEFGAIDGEPGQMILADRRLGDGEEMACAIDHHMKIAALRGAKSNGPGGETLAPLEASTR